MERSRSKIGWMAIKVDLEKAFDRLGWDFIRDTLLVLDMPHDFIALIMECISSSSLRIKWNGQLLNDFRPSRGIRQGFPMSPYIFVLCMERLAHCIQEAVDTGAWKPISLFSAGPPILHLFFADDLLLFGKAIEATCVSIKSVLDIFSVASDHKVSIAKTQVFFSPSLDLRTRDTINRVFRFHSVTNLGCYLGFSVLHKGSCTTKFEFIVENVKRKLSGWCAKTLSMAARFTLAKSVLAVIPSFCMQIVLVPISIMKRIETLIRQFVWGGVEEATKCNLVAWSGICQPK